jgi:hypothetical protein
MKSVTQKCLFLDSNDLDKDGSLKPEVKVALAEAELALFDGFHAVLVIKSKFTDKSCAQDIRAAGIKWTR